MNDNLAKKTHCRFCGTELNNVFVDLGMSPICNNIVKPHQINAMEPFYPLLVYVCEECFLVQLDEYVSPDEIFDDYTYFSSFSTSWLEHCKKYTHMMIERFGFDSNSKVAELASNDGYLLQYFVEKGVPVLGIEPAANVAKVAEEKGIPTVVKFFGVQTAQEVVEEHGKANLILGNNVLAHVPDINDFVGGMKIFLEKEGVITIEFPHLLQLINHNQFDTIYHEHFSYLSFTTVDRIFKEHGLRLFDVEEIPTHGGSLRIYGKHDDDESKPVSERAIELLKREEDTGFKKLEYYAGFSDKVKETKRKVLEFLISVRREGKSVVGYGAPGKGNTLLNYCGIRTDFLDYTVDRSPYKQNNYLPGTHIPIYSPDKIAETKPDYVFILPWNLKDEIINQLSYIREWGGKFIVPIPEVKVYD